MEADKDRDGKISFEEFTKMVENTDVSMSMTLGAALLPLFLPLGFICERWGLVLTMPFALRSILRVGYAPIPHYLGVPQQAR